MTADRMSQSSELEYHRQITLRARREGVPERDLSWVVAWRAAIHAATHPVDGDL